MRFIVLGLLFFMNACGEAAVSFSVTRTSQSTAERCPLGISVLAALGFGSFAAMKFSESQEFQNQGVAPEDVDSLRLRSLQLSVETPSGTDLSYLDRVSFYAEAPGQPKILVANKTGFPAGSSTLAFDIMDVELKPYVAADSMSLTTVVEARGCPPDTQQLSATAVFDVSATASGVQRYLSQ